MGVDLKEDHPVADAKFDTSSNLWTIYIEDITVTYTARVTIYITLITITLN